MLIKSCHVNNAVDISDSKVHGANMGPTWVLSAPDGPHVGTMNLAIRDSYTQGCQVDDITYSGAQICNVAQI